MEHVEDVERLSKCGLGSVQTHLQDQQHRRRLHGTVRITHLARQRTEY